MLDSYRFAAFLKNVVRQSGFGWVPKIPDLDGVACSFLQGANSFALACGRNVHGRYVAADWTPDEYKDRPRSRDVSFRRQRWTTEIRADSGFDIAFAAEVDRHENPPFLLILPKTSPYPSQVRHTRGIRFKPFKRSTPSSAAASPPFLSRIGPEPHQGSSSGPSPQTGDGVRRRMV